MAFLLGDESCIESLRSDLADIQQTIDEIIVRTGPLKCYSWKSPDKLASDLKINELLDRYSYGDDEVDNQVAHYSLLELIIDRLLLLTYISTYYAEQTLSSNEQATSSSKITRLSAGLSIKKFWNKYTNLCTSFRQLNSQTKTNNVRKNSQDLTKTTPVLEKQAPRQSIKTPSARQIAEEVSNKSVQTNETAFVPCESCAKVQTNLKQNADQIINMCHYQNINSQVGKFRANLMANQLVGGWLSGADLERWLVEQDKDLGKIAKQIEFLTKNNEMLKSKLNENEETIKKIQQNEKDLKKEVKEEKDTREIIVKQYEKKLNDLKVETQKKISNLEDEIQNLNQIKKNLEDKNVNLKSLYENNEKIVIELTETNKLLTGEVNVNTEHRLKIVQLEEEKLVLNKELDCLKRELNDKTNDLNSERTKLENLVRAEQSLRLKHESVLESMDKLSADYETIKKKFDYVDEEKHQLIDSLKYKETLIDNLKYESEILQNSIGNLKLELKKHKDNETLLIRYPDLYGQMEQLDDDQLNVVEDMQNQIRANKHRISLLESLNNKLMTSIRKLNETIGTNESVGASYDEKNYFMKPKESSSRSQSILETPKPLENSSFSRPVPLFKLENEIESKTEQNSTDLDSTKKYWNQEESLKVKNESASNSDDEFDFLKDKRESDQNYLEKLKQISQNTELRVENTDFNLIGRNSRRGSNLFSPSTSSITSHSRTSQHSAYRPNIKTPPPPIPPAEKNMEVIVGKGRRVNSATNSARSNISNNNNNTTSKNNTSVNSKRVDSARGKPPASGRSSALVDKPGFKCDNCNKKYDDSKNLDIHKLYCNK